MNRLSHVRLAGWKSIRDASLDLRPLNILIGGNGAGKSNLVSFFKLMRATLREGFQDKVLTAGGADALLHYGAKVTQRVAADFHFTTDEGENRYLVRLAPVPVDRLMFEEEVGEFLRAEADRPHVRVQNRGHLDSFLHRSTEGEPAKFLRERLTRWGVYHFHDTSAHSPLRRECPVAANRFLHPDGSNLPAMLYLYKQQFNTTYRRITAAVRAIAPYFEDFVLEPLRLNPRNIALYWLAKNADVGTGTGAYADYDFGPHQLSDGTLRAIALFTVLLQPDEDLPELIILDEPELGLHPAGLAVLADLMKLASEKSQLIIATQSAMLLDFFEPEDIVTVNLRGGSSNFERLDGEQLKHWLEDYTLSELWEQNVIGGGPYG